MRKLIALAVCLLLASPAWAQNNGITSGNQVVPGHVLFCFTGATSTDGSLAVVPCASAGAAITAIFSGADTASATATLAAAAGKFTYICGFNVGGLGATAQTIVSPTVGVVTGGNTLTYSGAYTFVTGAAAADVPFNVTYQPCIKGNAVNTAIVVTVPGAAGNTSTTINAWGYQQ